MSKKSRRIKIEEIVKEKIGKQKHKTRRKLSREKSFGILKAELITWGR